MPTYSTTTTRTLAETLGAEELRRLVVAAIEEDLGDGDLSSSTAVPAGTRALDSARVSGGG